MNAKFRGLRKDGKGWAYGTPIYACGRAYITEDAYDAKPPIPCWTVPVGETWEVIPSTVGQFTGRVSLGNKEIYAGDSGVHKQAGRYEILLGDYADNLHLCVGFYIYWNAKAVRNSFRRDLGFWISKGLEFESTIHDAEVK